MKLRSRLSRAILATGFCCAPAPLMADTSALTIVPAQAATALLPADSASTINTSGALSVDGGYGVMNMTGGSVTVGSWLALGRGGGVGVMNNNSGGTLTVNANNATIGSFGATSAAGQIRVNPGGASTTLTGAGVGVFAGENFPGTLNVARTPTFVDISNATVINQDVSLHNNGPMGPFRPSSQGTSGSLTYSGNTTVNSGRVTTTPFLSPLSSAWSTTSGLTKSGAGTLTLTGSNTGTLGTVNTSGGILSVGGVPSGVLNVSGSGLLTSGTLRLLRTTPVTFVNLANGGTIGASALTPGSFFVQNFNPSDGNSGVMGTPFAKIGGVGNMTSIGASAIANIDSSGNLTGITLTSPGNSYTSVPSFSLVNNTASGGTITAVPEPSGLVLGGLASAAFLLGGRIRRRSC